jgi:hypothetical protein
MRGRSGRSADAATGTSAAAGSGDHRGAERGQRRGRLDAEPALGGEDQKPWYLLAGRQPGGGRPRRPQAGPAGAHRPQPEAGRGLHGVQGVATSSSWGRASWGSTGVSSPVHSSARTGRGGLGLEVEPLGRPRRPSAAPGRGRAGGSRRAHRHHAMVRRSGRSPTAARRPARPPRRPRRRRRRRPRRSRRRRRRRPARATVGGPLDGGDRRRGAHTAAARRSPRT